MHGSIFPLLCGKINIFTRTLVPVAKILILTFFLMGHRTCFGETLGVRKTETTGRGVR